MSAGRYIRTFSSFRRQTVTNTATSPSVKWSCTVSRSISAENPLPHTCVFTALSLLECSHLLELFFEARRIPTLQGSLSKYPTALNNPRFCSCRSPAISRIRDSCRHADSLHNFATGRESLAGVSAENEHTCHVFTFRCSHRSKAFQ
jgi:hypothetical protein